jgi:hypothetical protein
MRRTAVFPVFLLTTGRRMTVSPHEYVYGQGAGVVCM